MIMTFQNDDAYFHDWRADHPDAFVANLPLAKPADLVLLHRAGCGRLKPPSGPDRTSHNYVCADDRREFERWLAENRARAPLSFCHYCYRPFRARRQAA